MTKVNGERYPPARRDKAVTLIAGCECVDGIIIATDLEVSGGERKALAAKSTWDSQAGKGLALAFAGRYDLMVYAAEELMRANLYKHTLLKLRADLHKIYMDHIHPIYSEEEKDSVLQIICGISGTGKRSLFISDRTILRRVRDYCFAGYGTALAFYLAKSWALKDRPATEAVALLRKIFHEVGRNTPYVGTEVSVTWLDLEGNGRNLIEE